jgi:hypothetical protein
MARMTKAKKAAASRAKLTPEQIDEAVTVQANEESAWEKPVSIQRSKSRSLSIPADLAARAAFLARLHHESHADKWIERIVRERVEIEESAYTAAKKSLVS